MNTGSPKGAPEALRTTQHADAHAPLALPYYRRRARLLRPIRRPFASSRRRTRDRASCYAVKQDPQTVSATITFYGWPDNSPPGNKIAHGVIHKRAGGDGTYCNPTTFATERANDEQIPYGIKIYVPFIKQYFIREDLCAASGPKKGSGSNGCKKLWFDLWIGGDGKSRSRAVIKCERELTPSEKVSGDPLSRRGNARRARGTDLSGRSGAQRYLRRHAGRLVSR